MEEIAVKEVTIKEVTVKELIAAFEGKHVNISPMDHYGIAINMRRATLELKDDKPELWLVSRDEENRVTASICIDEGSIESIEDCGDGTYVIYFSLNMASIDISESLEE